MQERPASGGHGVDVHHRGGNANPRHLRVENPLKLTGEMADIRGGPPHVKADHIGLVGNLADPDGPHDTSGWTAQNRVLSLKELGVGEAP